jgi:hypothetical protein
MFGANDREYLSLKSLCQFQKSQILNISRIKDIRGKTMTELTVGELMFKSYAGVIAILLLAIIL